LQNVFAFEIAVVSLEFLDAATCTDLANDHARQ
jgi:hypothetical protein